MMIGACSFLLIAAALFTAVSAGITLSHPNVTKTFVATTCIYHTIRPNTPDPGNTTRHRDGRLAFIGALGPSDVKRLCAGEAVEGPDGLMFEGLWLVNNAIWKLCGWNRRIGGMLEKYLQIVDVNQAAGLLRLGEGDPELPQLYQTPAVSMRMSYDVPRDQEPLVWRSFWCSPVSNLPDGFLGALDGSVEGEPIGEFRIDIDVDHSPWEDTLDSAFYFGFFSLFAPACCFVLAGVSSVLLIRYSTSKGGTRAFGPKALVLLIECIANFMLGWYFVFCGHFARTVPIVYSLCFYPFLGGVGMCTTFLTALFWVALKRGITTLQKVSQTGFLGGRTRVVITLCIMFVALDIFSPVATYYETPGFEQMSGFFLFVGQLSISVYFFREVRSTVKIVAASLQSRISAKASGKIHGSVSSTKVALLRIRRVAGFLVASSCFMLLYCLTALTAVFGFLWDPAVGWPLSWSLFFISRFGTAATQIGAVVVSSQGGGGI